MRGSDIMEQKWASPGIKEYVEYLQKEIAKAYAVPAYLLRSPDIAQRVGQHQMEMERATTVMRRELVHLVNELFDP